MSAETLCPFCRGWGDIAATGEVCEHCGGHGFKTDKPMGLEYLRSIPGLMDKIVADFVKRSESRRAS